MQIRKSAGVVFFRSEHPIKTANNLHLLLLPETLSVKLDGDSFPTETCLTFWAITADSDLTGNPSPGKINTNQFSLHERSIEVEIK